MPDILSFKDDRKQVLKHSQAPDLRWVRKNERKWVTFCERQRHHLNPGAGAFAERPVDGGALLHPGVQLGGDYTRHDPNRPNDRASLVEEARGGYAKC